MNPNDTRTILPKTVAMSPASLTSNNVKFVSDSPLNTYEKAAVAANGPECAQVGSDILKLKNGSAVDAAIAVLLCEGVASLHSAGLGGGFLMAIYDAPSGAAVFLNARESAPGLANTTMFEGNETLNLCGGLAVAVPGELLGYWEAHQKYGRIPWKELFEPAIELCKTGTIITKYLENHINNQEKYIRASPTLSEILVDPETNRLFGEGDKIKRPKLAMTLRELADAKNPVDLFYRGRIAKQLIDEIKIFGGIVTADDFASYRVKWTSPIEAKTDEITIFSAPPPGSGALLTFILNIFKDFMPITDNDVSWARIIEAFKWAYAKRTELADPDFVDIDEIVDNLVSPDHADAVRALMKDDETHDDPKYYGAVTVNKDDGGTTHICVLAPDGSAVSATSSINQVFGAKIRSPSTGIIFNNAMGDFCVPGIVSAFGLPASPNNFIQPYKRPFSSMTPTIVVDKNGKVALVIGAAGGTRIVTALAFIMALFLWNDYDIKEAVDAYRLHHQLFPMEFLTDRGFSQNILNYLDKIGHRHKYFTTIGSAVNAIAVKNGSITANSDYRRQGKTAGF